MPLYALPAFRAFAARFARAVAPRAQRGAWRAHDFCPPAAVISLRARRRTQHRAQRNMRKSFAPPCRDVARAMMSMLMPPFTIRFCRRCCQARPAFAFSAACCRCSRHARYADYLSPDDALPDADTMLFSPFFRCRSFISFFDTFFFTILMMSLFMITMSMIIDAADYRHAMR